MLNSPPCAVTTNERLNSVTHLAGLALAVLGAAVLLRRSLVLADVRVILSVLVFSAAMIGLYAASSIYHSAKGPRKPRYAKADHCAIYLMIAGTYTPFGLQTVHSVWGALMFVLVWAVAAAGICKEIGALKNAKPSLAWYIAMGWVALAAAVPLLFALSGSAWLWLLLGGLFYTLGIPFYLNQHWAHAHGVWHLFVLGGTAAHFFAVWQLLT